LDCIMSAAFFLAQRVLLRVVMRREPALRTVFFMLRPVALLRVAGRRVRVEEARRAAGLRVVLRAADLRDVVLRAVALRAVLLRDVVLRDVALRAGLRLLRDAALRVLRLLLALALRRVVVRLRLVIKLPLLWVRILLFLVLFSAAEVQT